ncbi:hypothetical protein QFW82_23730 [Streptomyces malaysiensis subsp. malaysiensis]|uniref:hypothetical protein n=1 Tax=Streptomyces malaysiensis TaxID=92644 RepID=UPI0024BFC566|nr:hypothetical protein [Streptomyces sp. NA07423]WHX19843.1 hypothetical protein QFW82_23730 [Streptomyces sp. NA07423]
MSIQYIGIDPDTRGDNCPTIWADTDSQELIAQGWLADTGLEAACNATSPSRAGIPDTEAVVRIPARMVPIIREACDALERAQLRETTGGDDALSRPSGDAG